MCQDVQGYVDVFGMMLKSFAFLELAKSLALNFTYASLIAYAAAAVNYGFKVLQYLILIIVP